MAVWVNSFSVHVLSHLSIAVDTRYFGDVEMLPDGVCLCWYSAAINSDAYSRRRPHDVGTRTSRGRLGSQLSLRGKGDHTSYSFQARWVLLGAEGWLSCIIVNKLGYPIWMPKDHAVVLIDGNQLLYHVTWPVPGFGTVATLVAWNLCANTQWWHWCICSSCVLDMEMSHQCRYTDGKVGWKCAFDPPHCFISEK